MTDIIGQAENLAALAFLDNGDTYYILNENREAVCVTYSEWTEWMRRNKYEAKLAPGTPCRVGWTGTDALHVSTVFLGHNYAYGDGPPILFETMVFGGEMDQEQERYSTWAEAEAGHRRWCELVFGR